jgi:methanogenic corrinoid protein MtbC1
MGSALGIDVTVENVLVPVIDVTDSLIALTGVMKRTVLM